MCCDFGRMENKRYIRARGFSRDSIAGFLLESATVIPVTICHDGLEQAGVSNLFAPC